MAHTKDKTDAAHGRKHTDAIADKRPIAGSRQLTREELEALRRQLQKKFHRS